MESLITYTTQYGLSEDLIQQIISKGETIKIKKSENLLSIGKRCNYIYFVTKGGFLGQYFDETKGEYRTIVFFIENYQRFITQPESFFKKTPSPSQIKAFTNSEVIAFHRSDIDELSSKYEAFDKFCNAKIIEALITESQFKSNLISLPKNKLYNYLTENHKPIIRNVPSKYIAEFMGVTPQWLSKIKRTI